MVDTRGVELEVVVGALVLEKDGLLDRLELSVGPGDWEAVVLPLLPPFVMDGVLDLVLEAVAGGAGDGEEATLGTAGFTALLAMLVLVLVLVSLLDSEPELEALGVSDDDTSTGDADALGDSESLAGTRDSALDEWKPEVTGTGSATRCRLREGVQNERLTHLSQALQVALTGMERLCSLR